MKKVTKEQTLHGFEGFNAVSNEELEKVDGGGKKEVILTCAVGGACAGAVAGGLAGASVGSAVPGLGTGFGAALGAFAGATAGFMEGVNAGLSIASHLPE